MGAGLMPKRIPKPLFSQYSGPPRTGIQTSQGRLRNPEYTAKWAESGLHPSIESGYGVSPEWAEYGLDRYPYMEEIRPTFAGKPTGRTQTAQQKADWDEANEKWERIEAARKKRKEAYEAMAQKTGDVPREYTSRMGDREAGDPFSPVQVAGGLAPSDVMARYGRPKRWPYLQSIVNMGQVT